MQIIRSEGKPLIQQTYYVFRNSIRFYCEFDFRFIFPWLKKRMEQRGSRSADYQPKTETRIFETFFHSIRVERIYKLNALVYFVYEYLNRMEKKTIMRSYACHPIETSHSPNTIVVLKVRVGRTNLIRRKSN